MQPPDTKSAKPEEEPEEGEILSDDLEDISDDSIICAPIHNGKSLSPTDHLQDLSLSSVTEHEDFVLEEEPPRKKRRTCIRKRNMHRHKRTRRKTMDSESSDDDNELNSTFKYQLKAAIRVEVDDAQKNTLLERLRPMIKKSNPADDDVPSEIKSDILISSDEKLEEVRISENSNSSDIQIIPEPSPKKDDDNDNELIHLRIAALKTAITNKVAKGKMRKKEENKENTDINNEEIQPSETAVSDVNSDTPMSPSTVSDTPHVIPPSPEEDEDVLRALLLASMSNKITNVPAELPKSVLPKVKAQLNNNRTSKLLNNNLKTKSVSNFKVNNVKSVASLVGIPQVKPLIIKVDSESDSDMDISSGSPEKPTPDSTPKEDEIVTEVNNKIQTTVEQFLKEQRAKVESEIKSTEKEEKDSKSTDLPKISEGLKRANNQKEITTNNNVNKVKKIIFAPQSNNLVQKKDVPVTKKKLDKSALKLLPANKQEEYRKLLLKLQKAETLKKPRVRKVSQKITAVINKSINEGLNNCASGILNKVSVVPAMLLNKVKFVTNKSVNNVASAVANCQKNEGGNVETKGPDKKAETLLLHNTLKAIQVRKDGRLQIQDKYKLLRPLVKKVNDVSKEQKHWGQEVKKLQEQLLEAENKYREAQKNVGSCIKDLVNRKLKIDRSLAQKPADRWITSTPIKPNLVPKPPSLEISSVPGVPLESDVTPKTPNQPSTVGTMEKETIIEEIDKILAETKDKDLPQTKPVENNKSAENHDITIVRDPNDVDDVIRKTKQQLAEMDIKRDIMLKKSEKMKYVSPLDVIKRTQTLDPYVEMCPYEVYGTCKDAECFYNHLPK